MLGLCGAVAGVARQHEELCAARIVACGQRIARCTLVGGGVLWLLLGLGLGPLLLQALAQGVVAELGSQCQQPALAIQWPVLGCQRVQQRAQIRELILAFAVSVFGGAHILGVAQLPQRPQGVAVDFRVARCQRRGECHVGTVHLPMQDLLARQQQTQGGVFRVAAQQVVQVGSRQRRIGCFGQAPLQCLARVQQPQATSHHAGEHGDKPVGCEHRAVNALGSESGYAQ